MTTIRRRHECSWPSLKRFVYVIIIIISEFPPWSPIWATRKASDNPYLWVRIKTCVCCVCCVSNPTWTKDTHYFGVKTLSQVIYVLSKYCQDHFTSTCDGGAGAGGSNESMANYGVPLNQMAKVIHVSYSHGQITATLSLCLSISTRIKWITGYEGQLSGHMARINRFINQSSDSLNNKKRISHSDVCLPRTRTFGEI